MTQHRPTPNEEYADLLDRLQAQAEDEFSHRWRNPAIREMAVYHDAPPSICPRCEKSIRREKLAKELLIAFASGFVIFFILALIFI